MGPNMSVVETLNEGGVVIYPTETLYALGCRADCSASVRRVVDLKGRPDHKPLPLIIGGMEQLDIIAAQLPADLLRLAERFWPGPLSLLVETKPFFPEQVRDKDGFTSVRWCAHPLAQRLCRQTGMALVATSANRSGKKAAATPAELDPLLTHGTDARLLDMPWPAGGQPSTVVRVLGGNLLEVLRDGAVSRRDLLDAGFSIASAG